MNSQQRGKMCHISAPPSLKLIKPIICLVWERVEKNKTATTHQTKTDASWLLSAGEKQRRLTRLVHSVASLPGTPSASSWPGTRVAAGGGGPEAPPPRATASCDSRSAMRWFSFSKRTFPSWASRSQCSFSCSSRAIFSWLCCTCGRMGGGGREEVRRAVSSWREQG